jgi:hypothetical protein
MANVEFRMPNGEIIQIEFEPVAEFRDDLMRQVARGEGGSPESIERSRAIREGLLRMSSQQLVLLVTELSNNLLTYGREIKRLSSLNHPS